MTNEVKPIAPAKALAPSIIKPEEQITMVRVWSQDLDKHIKTQNFELTPDERNFGVSIITGLVDKCAKDKIDTNQLNMTNFLEQVKHYGKMQLSLQEQDIYLDVRNNKDTGLKDVAIRKQYQGIQKLMTRYSTKKIVRFADGIVCTGDKFSNVFDYATGLNKIVYEPNDEVNHNDLKNITKAFAIAYVEELGKLVPYVVVINKTRIMRAYNASPSKEKTVWNTDTARMVRKTAYWCLYNDIFKPFIEIPSNLQTSFAATEDDMEFSNESEVVNAQTYDIPVESNFSAPEQEETIVIENNPAHEVYYSEYKNNKDKYNLVPGSYNDQTKTCMVTDK